MDNVTSTPLGLSDDDMTRWIRHTLDVVDDWHIANLIRTRDGSGQDYIPIDEFLRDVDAGR